MVQRKKHKHDYVVLFIFLEEHVDIINQENYPNTGTRARKTRLAKSRIA